MREDIVLTCHQILRIDLAKWIVSKLHYNNWSFCLQLSSAIHYFGRKIMCYDLYQSIKTYKSCAVHTVEDLWADTLISGQLFLRPSWQNPVWTLAHTNSVFTHFHKRPAPVADTFSVSRGCPLTGALTVQYFNPKNKWQGQITYLSPRSWQSLQVLDHKHGHILEGAPRSIFWSPWFGPAMMGSLHCQSAE